MSVYLETLNWSFYPFVSCNLDLVHVPLQLANFDLTVNIESLLCPQTAEYSRCSTLQLRLGKRMAFQPNTQSTRKTHEDSPGLSLTKTIMWHKINISRNNKKKNISLIAKLN